MTTTNMGGARRARVKTQVIDGIQIWGAPIGKEYRIRPGEFTMQWLYESERQRDLVCVRDDVTGHAIPIDVLEFIHD